MEKRMTIQELVRARIDARNRDDWGMCAYYDSAGEDYTNEGYRELLQLHLVRENQATVQARPYASIGEFETYYFIVIPEEGKTKEELAVKIAHGLDLEVDGGIACPGHLFYLADKLRYLASRGVRPEQNIKKAQELETEARG